MQFHKCGSRGCQCILLCVTWVSARVDRHTFESRYTPLRMARLDVPRGVHPHWDQFHLAVFQSGLQIEDPGSPTVEKSLCREFQVLQNYDMIFQPQPLSLCFGLSVGWVQHPSKMPCATFCSSQAIWCWRTRNGLFQMSGCLAGFCLCLSPASPKPEPRFQKTMVQKKNLRQELQSWEPRGGRENMVVLAGMLFQRPLVSMSFLSYKYLYIWSSDMCWPLKGQMVQLGSFSTSLAVTGMDNALSPETAVFCDVSYSLSMWQDLGSPRRWISGQICIVLS